MTIKIQGRAPTIIMMSALATALSLLVSCSEKKADKDIEASGTIEAREVNIASQVAGQVRELNAEEGSRVKTGDILALIDHDSLDIQLRQAEAGAALAQAQLDLLRRGARDEDIRHGEEALKQAEAHFKVASDDVERMRELAAKGSVTLKRKEDAELRYTVALAQKVQAQENLNKLKRLARPEEIRAAEARLAQAAAAADLLQKTIADCAIVSPASGVVTSRPVEVGELVVQGAVVMTVSELERVHVILYVTEKELGRVRLGQEADVIIDSAPDRIFKGRVTYISPEAEFTPKNVQTKEDRVKLVFGVKVEIANPEGILKPGMPADARLPAAGDTNPIRQRKPGSDGF